MSLSGNLGFVPVDEVLRLLTRSHQQGAVDVMGNGLHGRVFVGKGGIDLATTYEDDELHRHLVNSRCADEQSLDRVTTGETTLAAIAESNAGLIELLREMTVESLYQIADRGEDFNVLEKVTTPYASPNSFELEALLQDAEKRRQEWEKVSDVIPDLTGAISFRRDLGDREEVTVKVDDWKVLSEIGTGSSVERIAERLGTTDFWTARVAARLANNELIVLTAPVSREEPADAGIGYQPVDDAPPADAYAAYEAQKIERSTPPPAEAVVEPAADDETDPDDSWWREPLEEEAIEEETTEKAPQVVSEGLSEIPPVDSRDDYDVGDDGDADVEEDTEAFLEKVFSELDSSESSDSSEQTESEVDEGHGLLRRRRMGTLRDFSSDS